MALSNALLHAPVAITILPPARIQPYFVWTPFTPPTPSSCKMARSTSSISYRTPLNGNTL